MLNLKNLNLKILIKDYILNQKVKKEKQKN